MENVGPGACACEDVSKRVACALNNLRHVQNINARPTIATIISKKALMIHAARRTAQASPVLVSTINTSGFNLA